MVHIALLIHFVTHQRCSITPTRSSPSVIKRQTLYSNIEMMASQHQANRVAGHNTVSKRALSKRLPDRNHRSLPVSLPSPKLHDPPATMRKPARISVATVLSIIPAGTRNSKRLYPNDEVCVLPIISQRTRDAPQDAKEKERMIDLTKLPQLLFLTSETVSCVASLKEG